MGKMLEKDGSRGLVPDRAEGAKDRAFNTYLNKLDPRNNELVQQALGETEDIRFQEFFERILSDRYRKVSLATIAKGCSIDLKEFNAWWGKASTQAAIAVAQTASIKVTQDIARDAESKESVCSRCDGLKWIAAPPGLPEDTLGYRMLGEDKWIRDCPECENGKVRRPGDAHARDKILEMSGLIQKGKGSSVVLNFGGAAHASALSSLDDAMTIDIRESA